MVSALPGAALLPPLTRVCDDVLVLALASLFDVQPATSAAAPTAAPPSNKRRRDRSGRTSFMTTSWSWMRWLMGALIGTSVVGRTFRWWRMLLWFSSRRSTGTRGPHRLRRPVRWVGPAVTLRVWVDCCQA